MTRMSSLRSLLSLEYPPRYLFSEFCIRLFVLDIILTKLKTIDILVRKIYDTYLNLLFILLVDNGLNPPSYLTDQHSPLFSTSSRGTNMNDVIDNGVNSYDGEEDAETIAQLRVEIEQLNEELTKSKSTIGKLKEKEKSMRDR